MVHICILQLKYKNMSWAMPLLLPKCRLKYKLKHYASICLHRKCIRNIHNFALDKPVVILGIETSCDDTSCGIVDSNGNILGEATNSQHLTHLRYGGIIPTVAAAMHRKNVTATCEEALRSANLRLRDITAIAVTVKPGLPMSLEAGTQFGRYLAKTGNKPFIPIHHMQAHALTARISQKVDYPFLAVLISGGHCLITVVENVDNFYLLGKSINNAPGEVFDKISRRLKLGCIPELKDMNGGAAIETAALKATNIDEFPFDSTMTQQINCNFSFSGIITNSIKYITQEELKHNILADNRIPNLYNLCGAVQFAIIRHICQRVQRAMEFVDKMSIIPKDKRTLVISGGVACNNLLAKALGIVSSERGFNFVRTPPNLCTDNGVMIAWNGIERWVADKGILRNQNDIEKVTVEHKSPLGEDWTAKVEAAGIKCKWIEIKQKLF